MSAHDPGLDEAVRRVGVAWAPDTSPLTPRFPQVWVRRDGCWQREAFPGNSNRGRTAN